MYLYEHSKRDNLYLQTDHLSLYRYSFTYFARRAKTNLAGKSRLCYSESPV